MSYFRSINQQVSVAFSDSSNLAVNQTFTSAAYSTLGVNAIQVNLKADQNCTLYVDQGPDTSTWPLSDTFNYYNNSGGDAWTTQATDAYTRIRVKNTGTSSTTTKYVSAVLCPIVEAVPRALSPEGNLRVGVYEIEGDWGTKVLVSPMHALKVTESTRLVGAAFIGDATDSNFWIGTGTGTGAATQTSGQATLATGATAASTIRLTSVRSARYVAANTNYYRGQVQVPTQGGACIRRWGPFSTTDGYFYQYDGTNISCMSRKSSVDTTVASGAFNGNYGTAYSLDTNCNTFEIYWTNNNAAYFINDELLHKATYSTTTAVATPTLPVGMEVNNGAGNTSNNTLVARSASISRLGQHSTSPTSKYVTGQTSSVCKLGAGNLQSIVIGAVVSTSVVTLYDNTAASGSVLWSSGSMVWGGTSYIFPFSLDFKGLPFFTGLAVAITTASANATVIYE